MRRQRRWREGATGAEANRAHPMKPLDRLQARIISCRKCPRLVRHREKVAKEKVRRFQGGEYWGKPVPSFGDRRARIVLVGLAPAAHGGNRTGRIFTGDRSGDFLFSALYRMGLASQPTSISRDDRLRLRGVYVTAAVRCAPPANRPTPQEQDKCRPYLERELGLLHGGKVIVALGALAWRTLLKSSGVRGRFAHGAEVVLPDGMVLLGCYHPSQQNTFTGKLTPRMLDEILERAKRVASSSDPGDPEDCCEEVGRIVE